jgi:soluble lytic murein transglycosylase-like protein
MKKKTLTLLIFLIIFQTNTFGQSLIDLNKIKQIESHGNPLAYNKSSGAKGLYQITQICLDEYNNYNNKSYNSNDLFIPSINETIASWYLEKRIPQMLKYYNLEVTVENILWAYNGGIGKVRKNIMDKETENYIEKYKHLK